MSYENVRVRVLSAIILLDVEEKTNYFSWPQNRESEKIEQASIDLDLYKDL